MPANYARAKWWQLYLTLPLLVVLFILDSRLKLSEHGHQAVQIGIILFVYGLVHLWLKSNAKALSNVEKGQFNETVTVTRIPLYQLPEAKIEKRPMFQFSQLEIKGVLSDTFEMDYIDAEFIQTAGVSQELNEKHSELFDQQVKS